MNLKLYKYKVNFGRADRPAMDETGASWLTLTGHNPPDYIDGE